MERKRIREEKAAERQKNALKTSKGKGIGKKSKKVIKNDENKTEIEIDGSKPKILSNIEVVTCDTCHRLAAKNKSLLCDCCHKYYHHRCIPNKHEQHIPDDEELSGFVCHKCFLLNDDDSESFENEDHQEDMF